MLKKDSVNSQNTFKKDKRTNSSQKMNTLLQSGIKSIKGTNISKPNTCNSKKVLNPHAVTNNEENTGLTSKSKALKTQKSINKGLTLSQTANK